MARVCGLFISFLVQLVTYRAYSCGNGLEYHVSMCHWPNSMADGQRACAAIANDVDVRRHELKLLLLCSTARFMPAFAFIISATVLTAFSWTSLKISASLCVTPGGSGCFSTVVAHRKHIEDGEK